VERRRANATTRLAISAAVQAVQDLSDEDIAQLPTVFSSSDGDGEVLASMLAALAQLQVSLSPTLFHNSVFNAPSGYWSIGSHSRVPSITVSAGAASFVAGLMEAHSQVCATGAAVLYVAYDAPFPSALASFARSVEPFACALRFEPVANSSASRYGRIDKSPPGPDPQQEPALVQVRERFSGNAAATRCRSCAPLPMASLKPCRSRTSTAPASGSTIAHDR
jgi:hypothetical protein